MGHHKRTIPDDLLALAARQGGMLSHAQAAEFGLSRNVIQRALDDHIWWPAARGLYSLSPFRTFLGAAHGGLLLGGDGAVLGGEAAGHLHGWCDEPAFIDVYVPTQRRDRGIWRFHRIDAAGSGTPRRTTPERTAVDLCTTAQDSAAALHLLADVLASRRTTADRIAAELERHGSRPGRRLLLDALADVARGHTSELERRFASLVLQPHGLPAPSTQRPFAGNGRADACFEHERVIVELDGRLGHEGAGTFRDHRRDNRNARDGWVTLRYGWDDVVTRPCAVAAELQSRLSARGSAARLVRCRRCAPTPAPRAAE